MNLAHQHPDVRRPRIELPLRAFRSAGVSICGRERFGSRRVPMMSLASRSAMRKIGVIDDKNGRVVQAISGQRQQYRPWISPLCPDAHPATLAHSYRDRCGIDEFYLADLNAIGGAPPDFETLQHAFSIARHSWDDSAWFPEPSELSA